MQNMHPSLANHLHDECSEYIDDLHRCHEEYPYQKFLGKCNDSKLKLMKCLENETLKRRRENRKIAMEGIEKTRKFRETIKTPK